MKRILWVLAAASFSATSSAATWNYLNGNATTLFFFDSESVVKKGATVTVWIKQVLDPKQIGPDGVASVVIRDAFDCKERTYRVMQSINYGKDGSVLATFSNPEPATEPAPDTFAYQFSKAACVSDFPGGKHPDLYALVTNNDVATFASNYFTYLANQKNDPAPKGPSVRWYGVTPGDLHQLYFFVPASVEKSPGKVRLWLKSVRNEEFPDSDGSYSTAYYQSFDCQNRTFRIETTVTYFKDRSVMQIAKVGEGEPSPVVPGSVAEYFLTFVCYPDFPELSHSDFYSHFDGTDIYEYTSKFFSDFKKSQSSATAK
jgi:hypothetical protein